MKTKKINEWQQTSLSNVDKETENYSAYLLPTQNSYGGAHFNFPNLFNQKIYCNVFFFLWSNSFLKMSLDHPRW